MGYPRKLASHRPGGRLPGPLGALAILLVAAAAPAAAQSRAPRGGLGVVRVFSELPLVATPRGNIERYWKLADARFEERVGAAGGTIEATNVSGVTLRGPLFYAEYLDARGRVCFTLVLYSWRTGSPGGPVGPGQTTRMFGLAPTLFPASRPVAVRVRLLRQDCPSPDCSMDRGDAPLRVPVAPLDGIPGPPDTARLQLLEAHSAASGPILDLLLAEITVGRSGSVSRVSLLLESDPAVGPWFRELVPLLKLYPAMDGGVRQQASTLVLVRAVLSSDGIGAERFAPRMRPWVVAVTRQLRGPVLPQVLQILLVRPPTVLRRTSGPTGQLQVTRRPPAPPGEFEVLPTVAAWVSPPLAAHPDRSAPYGVALRLGPFFR